MKLTLNVDFDSLEECLEFCTVLQEHFGGQGSAVKLKGNVTQKTTTLPNVQEPVPPESETRKASNKATHKVRHITVPEKPKVRNNKQTYRRAPRGRVGCASLLAPFDLRRLGALLGALRSHSFTQ